MNRDSWLRRNWFDAAPLFGDRMFRLGQQQSQTGRRTFRAGSGSDRSLPRWCGIRTHQAAQASAVRRMKSAATAPAAKPNSAAASWASAARPVKCVATTNAALKGTCCDFTTGSRTETTEQCCLAQNGTFRGSGTTCTPSDLCQPKCDNCQPYSSSVFECFHWFNAALGSACWTTRCIENQIDSASCTFHPQRVIA